MTITVSSFISKSIRHFPVKNQNSLQPVELNKLDMRYHAISITPGLTWFLACYHIITGNIERTKGIRKRANQIIK